MSDALGTPGGVVSDEDHRLAIAGLLSAQSSSIAVRTGVMWGPGTTAIVTGTSATGAMTVNVGLCHWVTSRAAGDGVYMGAKEASTTVAIAAAPGSNSRIDVVYAKQNDSASTISPDGSTGELYGVVTGTAAVSPTKPALPVGAVEVGTVTVAAGATNTLGAGVTINNTAPLVVARGADVPVRSQAERDALTTFPMLSVKRLDTGAIEMRNAANSAWVTVYDPTIPALSALPRGRVASTTFTADFGSTISTTELVVDTVTFTAVAGRRYKLIWDASWVVATSASTVQFNIRSAAGASLTTAGTLRRGRTATAWTVGNWTQQVLVAEITGLAAGQVTVGVGAQVLLGGGTVSIRGAAGNERTLIVEDIGV